MKNQVELEYVFAGWVAYLRTELGTGRFRGGANRTELLTTLVQDLVTAGASEEDAKNLKHKVVSELVTMEGIKGTGKHKNWKENVVAEYLGCVYNTYKQDTQDNNKGSNNAINTTNNHNTVTLTNNLVSKEQQTIIDVWGKKKFGELWQGKIIELAYTKESSLQNQFLDEFFGGKHG
jgi:hypothetical protein